MIGKRLLDRYELTDEIGRGGMGVVYRAQDPVLHREVAVKMIPPAQLTAKSEERFRREAQLVAGMDHPGIVPIHDFGHHEGALFFVMPLVRGTLLSERIAARDLTLGEILEIGIQVAEALEYSHQRDVLHRDVKPNNLMVVGEGGAMRVRVMDFGLAHAAAETRLTQTGGLVGTLGCLSPEQVASRRVDTRSDLYGLGTVLYECLAGELPFSGPSHAVLYRIVHEPPLSLRVAGIDVDDSLDRMVLGCLAKEPGLRPQTGRELADQLIEYRDRLREEVRRRLVGKASQPGAPTTTATLLPLVGREAEIAELQRRLHAALQGECQFVLIGGEAGSGKSRLLHEIETLAKARRLTVLQGRCADRESAIPYQGLCEVIQSFFRGRESSSTWGAGGEESAGAPDLRDLAAELIAFFPVLSEVRELREAAQGESGSLEIRTAIEGEDPTYLFELLARTLTRLSGGEAMVLLLENLHAGDVSLEALRYIVRRLGPTPTLCIGTYRSEEIERGHPLLTLQRSFEDDPRCGHLLLGPLADEEVRQLVLQQVGGGNLEESLIRRLCEATEGNPLFLSELVRTLLESGELARGESGVWTLSLESGLADALPATIQQAVERRFERLSEDLRGILSLAAVLGRSFSFQMLEELAAATDEALDSDALDDAVDSLVHLGLLEEERKSRDDRLTFTSSVVREIVYGGISRRRRRALHRRSARILETRWAGRLERVYPQLVHHFSEGDVAAETVRYATAWARRALETWSPEEALRAVRAALDLVEDEALADPHRSAGELHALAAAAYHALGRTTRALTAAQRAVAGFERCGDPAAAADAAHTAAAAAWRARRIRQARLWVERGVELARRGAANETLHRLLTLGATLANLRGEHRDARRWLDEAARLAAVASGGEEEEIPDGGTLVTVLPNPVVSLRPGELRTNEEVEVAALLFDTLLDCDAEGRCCPNLASSWDLRDDDRELVVQLRSDVHFSDGRPLDAVAVKKALEGAAQRGEASALTAVVGWEALRRSEAAELAGLEIRGSHLLAFRLREPLPILPALLTDPNTAIALPENGGFGAALLGTGPFVLGDGDRDRLVLERNAADWRKRSARLERIEFRRVAGAGEIAAGLRSGEIDLGRDLPPADLEDILRDPRFRGGLVEATKLNVYLVIFRQDGPLARHAALRRALVGVIRTHDLVWRTLGRFAQPAIGLLPPGILGHDPGRRLRTLTREEATELLRSLQQPLAERPLRAAIHPLLLGRYRSLTESLLAEWAAIGARVEFEELDIEDFLKISQEPGEIDLLLGRWNADYVDPDDFTHHLFHSRSGFYHRLYSSPEGDEILDRARCEGRPEARQKLYRQFEDLLAEDAAVLPLFHDIDYRIAARCLRGTRLRPAAPYVNYDEIGKAAAEIRATPRLGGGELHVPLPLRLSDLDPISSTISEALEIKATLFEPLTRLASSAQIEPWLAESWETVDGGRSYHFRLRSDVRFHDGRRLGARDVRFTFERLLASPHHESHVLLFPIRGSRALLAGTASALEGFRILSATEFVVELERPLAFFPALLTHAGLGIVPEGSSDFRGSWRDGCVGTGPFRLVRFEPGERVDLERHPHYWRQGLPKTERLSFHLGLSSARMVEELRAGRLSMASHLEPADVEALRRDSALAGCFREAPRLATYYLVFNIRRGPFADAGARRALARSLDIDNILAVTLGGLVDRAHALSPPGLLGYELTAAERSADSSELAALRGVVARGLIIPSFFGPFAAFWNKLREDLESLGMDIEVREDPGDSAGTTMLKTSDFGVQRWIADYPDPDSFFYSLLSAEAGIFKDICSSAEIDARIAKAREETDPALRHAIYRDLEEHLAREALIVPLFHDQSYRICHPRLRGFQLGYCLPEVAYEELEFEL